LIEGSGVIFRRGDWFIRCPCKRSARFSDGKQYRVSWFGGDDIERLKKLVQTIRIQLNLYTLRAQKALGIDAPAVCMISPHSAVASVYGQSLMNPYALAPALRRIRFLLPMSMFFFNLRAQRRLDLTVSRRDLDCL
jgi:hypothetical protein